MVGLLAAGSHATAAFLAITALEKPTMMRIEPFWWSIEPAARTKYPLYGHAKKFELALGRPLRSEASYRGAIGEERIRELLAQGEAGELAKLREATLYVAQGVGGLITPRSEVSPQTTRELLLLAIEACVGGFVGGALHAAGASDGGVVGKVGGVVRPGTHRRCS